MARLAQNPFCLGCTQDVIRDCAETLGVNKQIPCPIRAIRRVAAAAQQVGIDNRTLIPMLQAGATIRDVLDVIDSRLRTNSASFAL